jgi:hypothetical protein
MPDLFVQTQSSETLHEFAERMAGILNLPALEHRESSNYVDGEYFTCSALAIEITFAHADEAGVEENAFWISLNLSGVRMHDQSLLEMLADLLARRLTLANEDVIRIHNAWSKDQAKRIFYRRSESALPLSEDDVIVTESPPAPLSK